MAKLTEIEKRQLLRPTAPGQQREPRLPMRPVQDYVAFLNFAGQAAPEVPKPARFQGENWKL